MRQIILLLWIVIFTNKIHSVEFNVFGSLQHRNEFGCNTTVILQCILDPRRLLVVWLIGQPVTSTTPVAAHCFGSTCSVNPIMSNLYDFSHEENSGESNVTIKNVTLAEDGMQYKCDDLNTSLTFDSVVQVPPVEETTQITSTYMSGTTQVMVTTGCVIPRTAELITFNWFIIQEDGKKEVYEEAISEPTRDESPCQIYSDCIQNGSVTLSNNFNIKEDPDAPKVYFQVQIVFCGKELFAVKTSSTFQPKISDGCINACDYCDCDIKELIIVIVVAWGGAITITFVGSCILKYSLRTMDLHECIFKLGSLPWIFLLAVILLYKGDKKRGLIPLVISFVLDAVFIGIDRYYVCSCENICEIELVDHLWASLIYVIVCAVYSVLKYIILDHNNVIAV